MAIDPALEAYIKQFKIGIRKTLHEPPEISLMRTKVAILEDSGFYNSPLSGSLGVYAIGIKCEIEMWDESNDEIKTVILNSIKKAQLQYKR